MNIRQIGNRCFYELNSQYLGQVLSDGKGGEAWIYHVVCLKTVYITGHKSRLRTIPTREDLRQSGDSTIEIS